MKIMILSDSHAMDKTTLLDLLKKQNVDAYIHCGDIYMMYERLPLNNFYIVKGNNDYGNIPKEITITLDSIPFFITHGHHYYVEYTIENLVQRAKEKNAKIVCYGHTHRPFLETIDELLVINPGSVSYPRGTYRDPTYCILDTHTLDVIFYNTKTNEPCDPFKITNKEPFSLKNWFR